MEVDWRMERECIIAASSDRKLIWEWKAVGMLMDEIYSFGFLVYGSQYISVAGTPISRLATTSLNDGQSHRLPVHI